MAVGQDILQIVEATWQSDGERLSAQGHLESYGLEHHEREVERVQLAILKLSEGRLERIPELVAAAKRDYRDILMWAEYPEDGRALWAARPNLSPREQAELESIRERDKEQYSRWRGEARRRPTKG